MEDFPWQACSSSGFLSLPQLKFFSQSQSQTGSCFDLSLQLVEKDGARNILIRKNEKTKCLKIINICYRTTNQTRITTSTEAGQTAERYDEIACLKPHILTIQPTISIL